MEEKVYNAIKAPLNEENIELVGVRFGEEDGEKTLFVTIDSENGVDLDLCVKATHIVNPIIDGLDLESNIETIKYSFILGSIGSGLDIEGWGS